VTFQSKTMALVRYPKFIPYIEFEYFWMLGSMLGFVLTTIRSAF